MLGDMYRRLRLGPLDVRGLPKVVGVDGASLGAKGGISCGVNIGEWAFGQTFLVCRNIAGPVVLGKNFTGEGCAGVHWTENDTGVLTVNLEGLIETPELVPTKIKCAVSLKRAPDLPPRGCAVVDVGINTDSKEKVQVVPDELCQFGSPGVCMCGLHADFAGGGTWWHPAWSSASVAQNICTYQGHTSWPLQRGTAPMAGCLKSTNWIQHQGIGCPSEHGKCSPCSPALQNSKIASFGPSTNKTPQLLVLTTRKANALTL